MCDFVVSLLTLGSRVVRVIVESSLAPLYSTYVSFRVHICSLNSESFKLTGLTRKLESSFPSPVRHVGYFFWYGISDEFRVSRLSSRPSGSAPTTHP
jgi:hypothetical protein